MEKYEGLIKKIKTKRTLINVIYILVVLIVLILCVPKKLVVLDKVIFSCEGLNPFVSALIFLFILFCYIITMAIALNPMTASMITECEPEQHLVLNIALNKSKNLDEIFAMDYFYLGDFERALSYAALQCNKKKSAVVCVGLFNNARCQFFLNDFQQLKNITEQFSKQIESVKTNKKAFDIYQKMLKVLMLMSAIAENNNDKVKELKDIEAWNNYKPTQGFINYLKGLAAYVTEDKQEAIYRFKLVKESLEKTIFAKLAEEKLTTFD